jgi:hypothetical protein
MTHDDGGQFRALLVGVWTYAPDSGFASLLGPPNDLEHLSSALRDPPSGRYAVSKLPNPTTGELLVTVQGFLQGAGRQDNLLLYYTGHGELSVNDGQLCLTSREGVRGTLDGSSLRFDMLHSWIKASPARSVTLILDCCKAGRAFKTSEPDIAGFLREDLKDLDVFTGQDVAGSSRPDGQSSAKAVNVLAAVPGYTDCPDAIDSSAMSPFTADLCETLTSLAPANEAGEVSLAVVVKHLCAEASATGRAMPYMWGAYGGANTYVAIRPSFLKDNLARSGLVPTKLQRTGAAQWRGEDLHVVLEPVHQIASHISKHHPALATIGGNIGRGKTWALCDVEAKLTHNEFRVITLVPSVEISDPDRLLLALKKYARSLQTDERPIVIIIDGIEWSILWEDFVKGTGELLRLDDGGGGVSVVMALETSASEMRSVWQLPPGMHVAGLNPADFIADLINSKIFPRIATWDSARLKSARNELLASSGADFWAVAHMAPVWAEGAAEEQVFRALWEDCIGPANPRQVQILKLVASLGRYNLWYPLRLAVEAGDIFVRLGAEFSRDKDGLRLNSALRCRAILVRREERGRVTFDSGISAADRAARPIVKRYVRDTLLDINRQNEVVTALARLHLRRHIFVPVVEYLSRRDRKGLTAWQKWADNWNDLSAAVRVLDIVRTVLTPDVANDLADHLVQYILDDRCEAIELPTLVATLEVLQRYHRGRGRQMPKTDQAIELLIGRAIDRLAEERHPAQIRRRLLSVLRRLNRLSPEIVEQIGPSLLRSTSPVSLADLLLILDFPNQVAPIMPRTRAWAHIALWTRVIDDILVHPELSWHSADLSLLAAQTILAGQLSDERASERLRRQLAARLRIAVPTGVHEVLSVLLRLDRKTAALLAGGLDVDTWSRGKYRHGSVQEIADLLGTLGKISADLARRSLYFNGVPDGELLGILVEELRSRNDAVAASKLLRTSARVEEQTGYVENGFAEQFARGLGEQFLIDAIKRDSRLTVLEHLIEGYVVAHSPSIDASRAAVEEIIEELVSFAASANGPRLALTLAQDHVLGLSLIDDLRARQRLTFSLMMSRMTDSIYASALSAYHLLGPLLFPGIEQEFADWVAECGMEWSENVLFQNISNEGNAITSLRAADAVRGTVARVGQLDAGKRLLAAFQRSYEGSKPSRKWSNRVLMTDVSDMAECLQLLRRLDVEDAESVVTSGVPRLERAMEKASPSIFSAILAAISRISPEVAGELANNCIRSGLCAEKISDLEVDNDVFYQAACLLQLARVEDRIFLRLVDPVRLSNIQANWREYVPVIRNPEVLAKFIDVVGVLGHDQAMQITHAINYRGLGVRLTRRDRSDVTGFGHLIDLLAALDRNIVRELVSPDDADWLLWFTSVRRLASLVDSLVDSGVVDAQHCGQVLSSRFSIELRKGWIRDQDRFWLGIGWLARSLRLKGVMLQSPEPTDQAIPEHLPSWTALWTATWASRWPGASQATTSAIASLKSCSMPPHLPWQAAASLTALAELSSRNEIEIPNILPEDLTAWDRALRASTNWTAALVNAIADNDQLRAAVKASWSPWEIHRLRASFTWTSQGWRPMPLHAVGVLDAL